MVPLAAEVGRIPAPQKLEFFVYFLFVPFVNTLLYISQRHNSSSDDARMISPHVEL